MFVWAKVPSVYENGAELADELLYDKSVFVSPGIVFGSNGNNYIRISLCANEANLNEALKRVETTKRILA